jgi:hypothetical protein
MKIQAHKLVEEKYGDQWSKEIEDRWEYQDFLDNPSWREGWISFDCAYYNQDDERLYLGITCFNSNRIFKAFDTQTGEFLDLGYSKIAHPQDAKFHRALVKWEKDGCLYGAIALLHDINKYWEAPGGAIVRFDPNTGDLKKVGIPLPHIYIQSTCIDQKRGVLYGQTFTPERMVKFDLNTYESEDLGPISSGMEMAQGENIELDDQGCAWCAWSVTRAWQAGAGKDRNRLCKYDPKQNKIIYYDGGLEKIDGSYGYEKVEGIFNLGGGRMYCSGANGSLYRLDTETGMGTYLFSPVQDRRSRLSSLRMGHDGFAYGIVGRDGNCEILRFDPKAETYEILGKLSDGNEDAFQVHDVAITPKGVLYACENDNPYRSSYLWEVELS